MLAQTLITLTPPVRLRAWISQSRVGGLVGQNEGEVFQSFAGVAVNSGSVGGGLVGWNGTGTVNQSYATGTVTAGSAAGGLVGINEQNISQSYASGAVSVGANGYAGGLVGYNSDFIVESYATGLVTGGGGAFLGGLAGSSLHDVGSYWDIQTSGQMNGGQGISTAVGLLSADFKAGLPSGLNTSSPPPVASGLVWGSNPTINNGYPYLLWQVASSTTPTSLLPQAALISITVTADSQTKLYGYADPILTYQITSGTLFAGDVFTQAR